MNRTRLTCLLTAGLVAALLLAVATPVTAQYRSLPKVSSGSNDDRAIGEKYHIELSGNVWNPTPDFTFQSEGLGIAGTVIDVDNDLGLENKPLYEGRLVLRPTKKAKFRVHAVPMVYTGDKVVNKELIFNGIKYTINTRVQTDFKWTAYRFTYEYDVFYRSRGYVGFMLEAKYADTKLTLDSAAASEFVKARAPIPAGGLVARVYPLKFVSITGEITYFRLPKSVDENASFNQTDYDVYGTVNIGNNFGIQAGFRSIDMAFKLDQDSGSVKLKGPYVGGVVRF
jgi:hypothetical protein